MSEVITSRQAEVDGRPTLRDGENTSPDARRIDLLNRIKHFFGIG